MTHKQDAGENPGPRKLRVDPRELARLQWRLHEAAEASGQCRLARRHRILAMSYERQADDL